MTNKIEEQAITPDQARQLLQEEQQARVDAAKAELDEWLPGWRQRHRVRLVIGILATEQGNAPQMLIVAEA